MYDIIVIGAGPAGLTAAIFARRASKKVLVFEAKTYGGQIINTLAIENYPAEAHISGFDFATKLYNQAKDLGAEIVFEKVVDINDKGDEKEVVTTKNTYTAKSVIIATGSENRKLGLPNENELVGRGLSYCATCDGAFYRGKTVAIAGGGDTAIEDALYLADICSKVYLINRFGTLKGDEFVINSLKEKNKIEIIYNTTITKLNAEKKLNSIEIKSNDGTVKTIDVDGLFVAVGRVPENQNFAKLIELDEAGYVKSGEDCMTKVPGIFVAGDNRIKELRQLVTATSDGAIAATNAVKYINNKK